MQSTTTTNQPKSLVKNSRVSPWVSRILYPLGSYLILPRFFSKIEIIGQENIPAEHPVIVAPTHRSRWDALIIPYSMGRMVSGRDMRFMVSANEVKGLQGWFIRRMGGFPVDTLRPGASTLRHSIELLQNKEMLVIFPEGNIFRDRQVHPLKRGVARIALDVVNEQPNLAVKILPVSLQYSESVPSWGATVKVSIGTPIDTASYFQDSVRRSSQKLTKALEAQLKKLHETS